MANEAYFAVSGYVATQPKVDTTRDGTPTLSMRVAWTPRVMSKATGEWTDQPTSFVSVICYRKVAENAAKSLRRGDPIVLRGTLKVREFTDRAGVKRNSVDVVADSLGHDLFRGTTHYTKTSRQSEQTAEEYQSSTAAGRNPLPGDMAARGPASDEAADAPDLGELDLDDERDPDDEPDLDDELDPDDLLTAQPASELLGAPA